MIFHISEGREKLLKRTLPPEILESSIVLVHVDRIEHRDMESRERERVINLTFALGHAETGKPVIILSRVPLKGLKESPLVAALFTSLEQLPNVRVLDGTYFTFKENIVKNAREMI